MSEQDIEYDGDTNTFEDDIDPNFNGTLGDNNYTQEFESTEDQNQYNDEFEPEQPTQQSPTSVIIKIISASNLPAADLNGKSDPYCIIKCGSWKEKTNAVQNTLDPEWNERFSFSYFLFHPIRLYSYYLCLSYIQQNSHLNTIQKNILICLNLK